jgi:hypothetical protein
MCLMAAQCVSAGEYINWHTLFTTKQISGLINVRY